MSTAPSTFRLSLLGNPSIEVEGGPRLGGRVSQRHRLALLALLALAPGRRMSRDKAITWLWPESDTEKGRNLLSVALYVIRTTLGERAVVGEGDELRLDGEVVTTDTAEFESALDRGDHAAAASLYKGPFLDGFFLSDAADFERWVSRERDRLSAGYRVALEALATAAEQAGDFVGAAERWKLRAAQDPYDSRVAVRLMEALERGGNRAGALQHASLHQRMLHDDFGIAPPANLSTLVERWKRDADRKPHTDHRAVEGTNDPVQTPALSPPSAADQDVNREELRRRPVRGGLSGMLRSRIGVGALLLIAGGSAAVWYRATAARANDPGASAALLSMAVLPLKNYSGNPSQEYFADGMTEELTTTLSKIEALRVIAPQSVMQFKRTTRPVPELARLLNVRYVVDGSVFQDGERVRITASLIDATRNTSVWSDRFERERGDVMVLQREVALAIARAIEVALTPEDNARLVSAPKVDPEAFELYMRGEQERYAASFSGDFSAATRYLSQAIARDSTYAAAYAGLALSYRFTGEQERARQSANKALEFDPKLAAAHMARGLIRESFDLDWEGAERAFREAIQSNPGYAEAHHELSMLLMRRRRFDEALLEGQRAVSLAPMSARFENGIGEVHGFAGRYEEALAVADHLLAKDSTFSGGYYLRGMALAELRRYAEAEAAWRRCARLAPIGCGFARGQLGYIYALAGRRVEALKLLDTLNVQWREHGRSSSAPGIAFQIATLHAGLDQTEEALDWLERGVATGGPPLYLGIEPTLRSLHAEPRFRALLKRVGLDE